MHGQAITPGIYRHYKGGYYRVLFTARDSNNDSISPDQLVVVYVSCKTGRAATRNASEFTQVVERTEDIDTHRFSFVSYDEVPEDAQK